MIRYRGDRLLRDKIVRRVLVTLHSGEGFDGLLYAVDDLSVVLRDTFAVLPSDRQPVDGELLIPRDEITYMQYLTT